MFASSLLTGQAEQHFSVVSRASGIDLADMSWDKFCSIMKGAYSRIEQDFAARVDFHDLKQKPDQDVNSLVRDMRGLFSKMDQLPDPKTQAFTLVSALEENLRKSVMRLAPRSGSWSDFDEAAEAAVVAEADLQRNRLLSHGAKGPAQTDQKRSQIPPICHPGSIAHPCAHSGASTCFSDLLIDLKIGSCRRWACSAESASTTIGILTPICFQSCARFA